MESFEKYLGMPANVSGQGAGVDHLIFWVHVLMLLLFIGWMAYFILVLLKFNNKAHPKADHTGVKSHSSTYLEAIVALIEGVLLIGLAIPLWAKAVDQFPDPKSKDVTVINIMAQQFDWFAWYPATNNTFAPQDRKFVSSDNPYGWDKASPNTKGNFVISKNLVVPVGKPVLVNITSMDVIHCFAIRPLRVTQDAIPGMKIPAWFQPVKEGTYQINCAQLCGNSHYAMRGTIKVVSQADYDKWIAKNATAGAGTGGGFD